MTENIDSPATNPKRSILSRVSGIVKSALTPRRETQMTNAQLTQRREQTDADERRQLAHYRQRLGAVGARTTIESAGRTAEATYRETVELTHDLLGVLSTYRQSTSPGYFRREVKANYGVKDEWIHLPRVLPDGGHVVLQYESAHKRNWNPFGRTPRDVSRDGFYHIRVIVVPADKVDRDLANNHLQNWVEGFAGTPTLKDAYYNPVMTHFGKDWAISLDPHETKEELVPIALTYSCPSERLDSSLNLHPNGSEDPNSPLRKTIEVPLYSEAGVSVEHGQNGKSRTMPGVRWDYGLNGDSLLLPGQKPEDGVSHRKISHEVIAEAEKVIQLASR